MRRRSCRRFSLCRSPTRCPSHRSAATALGTRWARARSAELAHHQLRGRREHLQAVLVHPVEPDVAPLLHQHEADLGQDLEVVGHRRLPQRRPRRRSPRRSSVAAPSPAGSRSTPATHPRHRNQLAHTSAEALSTSINIEASRYSLGWQRPQLPPRRGLAGNLTLASDDTWYTRSDRAVTQEDGAAGPPRSRLVLRPRGSRAFTLGGQILGVCRGFG